MPRTASTPVRGSLRASAGPLPPPMDPMLATAGELPPDTGLWDFEFKWDGVRVVASTDGVRLRLDSRNRLDVTDKYPELRPLARAVGRRAVFDGEVVALGDVDKPSFARLQRRMHVVSPAAAVRLSEEVPVWYVVFDLLALDGETIMDRPLWRRREMLGEVTVAGPRWQVSPSHVGEGVALLEAARANGLEGVVAKRLDSVYEPGRRSPAWRKVKIVHRQEFVVGGWLPQEGGHRVGALLLGYYDCGGRLRFAGGVGSGFSDADHERLLDRFAGHARAASPFAEPLPARGTARFLSPQLVAEVEFLRWPEGGLVQQAAFKGLRPDKDARDVVKESHLPV